MTEKYSIGDWMYSNNNPNAFWKITGIRKYSGRLPTRYDVAFMIDDPGKILLRYYGDLSGVPEDELRPITKPQDILLCLASDLQEKHDKISREARKIKEDIDAMICARQLYLEYARKIGLKTEAAQKEVIGTFEIDPDKHRFVRVTLNVKE